MAHRASCFSTGTVSFFSILKKKEEKTKKEGEGLLLGFTMVIERFIAALARVAIERTHREIFSSLVVSTPK